MYEAHFGLGAQPFRNAPDPNWHVELASQGRVVGVLLDAILRGETLVPLVGDAGAGKTTLARRLLQEVDPARHLAAVVAPAGVDGDLLERVARALGRPHADGAPSMEDVAARLDALVAAGRDAWLLVDDAHGLDVAALTLLNELTTPRADGRLALRVILAGIGLPAGVAQLERIGLPVHLSATVQVAPLDLDGTRAYLRGRLALAGWSGRPAFDDATTAAIHARCGGNPGRINRLCGHILLQLHLQDRHDLGADIVEAVDALLQSELQGVPATLALPPVDQTVVARDAHTPVSTAPLLVESCDLNIDFPPLDAFAPRPAMPVVTALLAQPSSDRSLVLPPSALRVRPPPRHRAAAIGVAAAAVVAVTAWQATAWMKEDAVQRRLSAVRMDSARPAVDAAPATPPTPPSLRMTLPSPDAPETADASAARAAPVARAVAAVVEAPVAAPVAASSIAQAVLDEAVPAAGPPVARRRHAAASAARHARPAAAATPSTCTLEGETLGLCVRSVARAAPADRRPDPAPEPEPARATKTAAPCDAVHATLALCTPPAPSGP